MNKNEKIFLIYAYEINKKSVYIGLTMNLTRRHREHCSVKQNDTVFRFCNENGYQIPEPKILESELTWIEAQAKEEDWINFYKNNGWGILNIASTGIYKSSVGAYSNEVSQTSSYSGSEVVFKEKIEPYSYEKCYSVAKKYDRIKDFKIYDLNVYLHAKKMGWFSDYTWIHTQNTEEKGIYQGEITYDVFLEHAKECKTKTEFSLKYRAYYTWGLKNGYNDSIFIKEKKTPYKIPEEYADLSFDDVANMINEIQTKTELYKKNQQLYNYCRYKGWLKGLFLNKKCKNKGKWVYNKVKRMNLNSINISKLVEIPTFNNYYIDVNNCKIYKKLKTKINEITPSIDEYGMRYYTLFKKNKDKKTYPYHKFLRLSLNKNDVNCVKYLDGNYSNTNLENLSFYKYDVEDIKQIHNYYNNYIDKYGNVYNSVDEILNKCVTIFNGKKYIGEYSIDNLVYSKFIFQIKDTVEVQHLDGDLMNNEYKNLFIEKEIVCDVEIISNDEKYTIYLYDEEGKKHTIGTLWSDSITKQIKSKLNEYLKKNNNISEWIDDFKENVYNELVKIDIKLYTDKMRTESSGCYWFEPRNCWKSKISYNGIEKTLGYFKEFEQGKMIYEIATIAIKYGYFESWYKNIKSEREIIKSCER